MLDDPRVVYDRRSAGQGTVYPPAEALGSPYWNQTMLMPSDIQRLDNWEAVYLPDVTLYPTLGKSWVIRDPGRETAQAIERHNRWCDRQAQHAQEGNSE